MGKPGGRHALRMYFNGIFALIIFVEIEMLTNTMHEVTHLLVIQIGGGSAAPMQLINSSGAVDMRGLQRNFFL